MSSSSAQPHSRGHLLHELLHQVSESELDWFFEHALPPLHPRINLTRTYFRLKKNAINKGGYWSVWSYYPVSAGAGGENGLYGKFDTLAEKICGACNITDVPRNVKFICIPDRSPESRTRPNTSKPDCVALRADAKCMTSGLERPRRLKKLRWLDIAVPSEFKLNATNPQYARDNRAKILWSLAYIMREDPRRRFVYGFTIEDVNMRLWFCSRSDVIVSKPFDFMKNHVATMNFILSICYASYAQLGWDETITFVKRTSRKPYSFLKIAVRNLDGTATYYHTKRVISNIGTDAVRGRGTRVWEVRRLDDRGKELPTPLVLRDGWRDADRPSEGTILNAIRGNTDLSEDIHELLEQHFLHVEAEGNVYVGDIPDHTRDVMLKGQALPEQHGMPQVPAELNDRITVAADFQVRLGSATAPERPELETPPLYSGKVHYRVVYRELGKTLREVSSMSEAFGHLSGVIEGIAALYECGWIHRNISIDNVLVIDGQVKISDLEYAKPLEDDQQPHGIRTGSIFFVSTEVENHRYLHRNALRVDKIPVLDGNWMNKKRKQDLQRLLSRTPPPPVPSVKIVIPFRHNVLHDAESALWLGFYVVLTIPPGLQAIQRPDNGNTYPTKKRKTQNAPPTSAASASTPAVTVGSPVASTSTASASVAVTRTPRASASKASSSAATSSKAFSSVR
ncbi:uncharacterized protein PHACADRAFT_209951 [Phanerochaete carnosa HHB-10118-sp]|uniref:Fungal-type protein kinase domain-containing protein n=1 Tax=Phanerochaete carnosa (strain HHB-10118-sp) TaxID=650164 RepID=K5W4Q4_PHACS|nr:uncharacterized protein PHACADRAFT_209951 [Phanerochaete carnosa HHB-10118-sp]EKM54135.1 hypothetical protein PHACADRAFT_209951 [Phanerochaete carnosa HHB-10118-sp]